MKIVPFAQWHLTVIGAERVAVGTELFVGANLALLVGPCVTVTTDDDIILASVGMVMIRKRTAEVWAIVSPTAKRHALALAKGVHWCFAEAIRRYSIRRFQASMPETDASARRWAETFGLTQEGPPMLDFGDNGEAYVRYVKRMRPDG